jgi:eukaryotic-like serine/threonine-protein kinase
VKLRAGIQVTDNVTLVEEIGGGAMGSVWLGEHKTLETHVAVKFIAEEIVKSRTDALDRFRREATAAAKIKSPHVVTMFDHGVMDDGTPYIVMELLEGESLQERIERGPLSLDDTATIVSQTSRALAAAHALGVIHRDIKPHNVFLVEMHGELFVKVLDFGIAKTLDVSEELTEPGTIVGTPHYVCRDLIMGGLYRDVDAHVDMWSLAVVAYKCLTGVLPFEGTSLNQICGALAAGKFARPSQHRPELSAEVDAWFTRALHPDKDERFAHVEALAASFRALATSEDQRPTTVIEPTKRSDAENRPSRAKSRRALALVIPAGIAVGVLIALFLVGSPPPLEPLASATFTAVVPTASVRPPPPPPPPAPVADPRTISEAARSRIGAEPGAAGDDEIGVPAGIVWLGCQDASDLDCNADEIPGHEVFLDAFFIDRFEVRVSDYGRCVVAGECDDRRINGYVQKGKLVPSTRCNWQQPGRDKHPLNCVSHPQAAAFCAWRGKRLPTEAEWERAARGDDRRIFPWGDEPASCIHAVMAQQGDEGCGRGSTWPVGSKAKDRSPFGALDMAGNLREWVADWYDPAAYGAAPVENPTGPETASQRVARGGSWGRIGSRYLRVSIREFRDPESRSAYVGFRCARNP